jgi:ANTAR domain
VAPDALARSGRPGAHPEQSASAIAPEDAPEASSAMILPGPGPARRAPELGDRIACATEEAASIMARLADARQRTEQVLAETERVRRLSAEVRRQWRSSPAGRELLQRSEYARLLARLETMPVVEQAKGIIMAQSHCAEAEAFDLLRRASQRSNIPVRALAAQIVARAAETAEPESGHGTSGNAPRHQRARRTSAGSSNDRGRDTAR